MENDIALNERGKRWLRALQDNLPSEVPEQLVVKAMLETEEWSLSGGFRRACIGIRDWLVEFRSRLVRLLVEAESLDRATVAAIIAKIPADLSGPGFQGH